MPGSIFSFVISLTKCKKNLVSTTLGVTFIQKITLLVYGTMETTTVYNVTVFLLHFTKYTARVFQKKNCLGLEEVNTYEPGNDLFPKVHNPL